MSESTDATARSAAGQREPLDGPGWVLLAAGGLMLANGIWMFIDPAHWYEELPAAVPDFGPLNAHFVRDIACAFTTMGAALVWSALRPPLRAPLVSFVAAFLALHALLHIRDTALGVVASNHWWLDLPGVYGPAVLMAWLALRFVREARSAATASP